MLPQEPGQSANRILVAYATRYGSTQVVAEAIAKTLSETGLRVDVRPAREVAILVGYRIVVLGAPFYLGSWHKDAQQFLIRNRVDLERRPLAIFALGPISGDEEEQRKAGAQLDEELEKYPWLKPLTTVMFGGKYDPTKLSFSHRLLTALPASPLHGLPASDLRDWTAIHEWATEVASALQPVVSR
jgi:menaquinone-dependent protoporphyrinogen oxidase